MFVCLSCCVIFQWRECICSSQLVILFVETDCCFVFLTFSRKDPKSFTFDHCFLSLDEEDSRFSSQEKVFEALGQDLLENAFQGYNACIFAYGQTGWKKNLSNFLILNFNKNMYLTSFISQYRYFCVLYTSTIFFIAYLILYTSGHVCSIILSTRSFVRLLLE